ncbi:hypothetical protein ACH3XW_37590 [Acanthocheilonema viteae]
MNPLYRAKSSNTEESESESINSLSSRQSFLHSERSVDSDYKSNSEEESEFRENIFKKQVNFREIATEMFDTMNALGVGTEENSPMKKALEERKHELEFNIGNYNRTY